MSDEQRSYLIAYDVKDDRRRSHVAKLLQSYGERMQYSVFLLRIRPAKLIAVQTVLETEIDLLSDSVVVCDLGPSSRVNQALNFIGVRGYKDIVIPTII